MPPWMRFTAGGEKPKRLRVALGVAGFVCVLLVGFATAFALAKWAQRGGSSSSLTNRWQGRLDELAVYNAAFPHHPAALQARNGRSLIRVLDRVKCRTW
jgi:hypothetical protein